MNSEADNITALYERHAKDWDTDRGTNLLEKSWLDRFLKRLPRAGSILDIGCGSGRPISRYLIEQGFEVTGVDSSPTLIDICRGRFPIQRWIVADMRDLCLNSRFDGIIAWDSFFHLCPQDQRRMFPIFHDHSLPNAALLFTSGTTEGEAIGEFRGEPLYHGSLSTGEYRQLLQQNGFEVNSHVEEDATCGFHTIWLAIAKCF